MRTLLVWADGSDIMVKMIQELLDQGFEIPYWVGLSGDRSSLPAMIFHDHYDAWSGKPAFGVSDGCIVPPSTELIEKMYKTESLVLTMMNKKFDTLSVDARRNLYYSMLGYWASVVDTYKIECIIFPTVPHTVYNYIIYGLAKLRGIKTIMFEDSWVSDRLLTYTDWKEGSQDLQAALQKNAGKSFVKEDLSEDICEYYKKQTDPKVDATPIYMTHWKKKFTGFGKLQSKWNVVKATLKDGTFFKKLFGYILKQRKMNLQKEYNPLAQKPRFDEKYVYVPLNFQPERTTSPQGDMYVDQVLMVETLSAALPEGMKIYVKEHPSQWWLRSGTAYSSSRYPGYYRQLASLKNVVLVPIMTSSFELMEKAWAVATVTGTAGWEALLRKKPVLIFGYPWYRDCESVFRIRSVETCQEAFAKIQNGFTVEESDIIRFLKSFDEATFHGYIESFVNKISKLDEKENRVNIVNTLIKKLKNN